jgi:hypothetical protein
MTRLTSRRRPAVQAQPRTCESAGFHGRAKGRPGRRPWLSRTSFDPLLVPTATHVRRSPDPKVRLAATRGAPSEESIKEGVLNGDDQDRCRLSSPFAEPPPRSVSRLRDLHHRRPCFRMGLELSQILFGPRIADEGLIFRHGFHSSLKRIDVAIVAARVEPIRSRSSTS